MTRKVTVSTDTETLALAVLDAINTRQLDRIRDLVTDDFVDHGSPIPLPPGPATSRFSPSSPKSCRSGTWSMTSLPRASRWRSAAPPTGSTRVAPEGIEPTGLPYAMKTAHFFRSRDGRLCEHWGIRDELDVLFQVGALQPPSASLPSLT